MIKVIYYREYNRLTVEGHAGSGPEGHDLVCASASALALTLAGNVAHMEAIGAVHGAAYWGESRAKAASHRYRSWESR